MLIIFYGYIITHIKSFETLLPEGLVDLSTRSQDASSRMSHDPDVDEVQTISGKIILTKICFILSLELVSRLANCSLPGLMI